MKQITLFVALIFTAGYSSGQSQDVWVRFYDSTAELSGCKDLQGHIKLPARYGGFTWADSFYHIIAVNSLVDGTYKSYYLLKDGRKVGFDSVYSFDFSFDCESEGKIIYKDRKKDRVGFFDKNGVAIIPAIYNYVSPFRNGMALACRNAKRQCWEKDGDTTRCEHLGWEGGESILINEKNEILADSLSIDLNHINWYSKKLNEPPADTHICVNIKGKNGATLWFVDYEKEFNKWFYNNFLQGLKNKDSLPGFLFDEVTFWKENEGWTSLGKNIYLNTFPGLLTTEHFRENNEKRISISQDLLNSMIFDKEIYIKYRNSCGQHNSARFPLFTVMFTYYKKRDKPDQSFEPGFLRDYQMDRQQHFEFLRTENGYRLLSVSGNF